MSVFMWGLLILCAHFYASSHIILITIVLSYNLKSGNISPELFFFLKIIWLFRISCGSTQVLGLFVLFLWKNEIGILIETALNLEITLSSMGILKILILLTHEYRVSFHLFVSSSISLIKVLEFSLHRSFTSSVKFFPKGRWEGDNGGQKRKEQTKEHKQRACGQGEWGKDKTTVTEQQF